EGVAWQNDQNIYFDLPEPLKVRSAKLAGLNLLTVPPSGRAEDIETYWRVEMDTRKFKTDPRVHWPVRYGDEIENAALITPAKKLTPGHYRMSIDVFIDDTSKPTGVRGAKMLMIDFVVNRDLRLATATGADATDAPR